MAVVSDKDDDEGSFVSVDVPGPARHPAPPAGGDHGGMQENRGKGWHKIEQMDRGDLDSIEQMQRTMRICSAIGCLMVACVVLASVMLWDNVGLGSQTRGYNFPHSSSSSSSSSASASASSSPHAGAAHNKLARFETEEQQKLRAHQRVKRLIADKALSLAQKAVIQRVAKTYAPASWFAAHQRPERAAILHVVSSKRAADKVQDEVEGELLDPHYHGQPNPIPHKVKEEAPHESQRELNDLIERAASVATAKAMKQMAGEVDKTWMDTGLGEHGGGGGGGGGGGRGGGAGWIRDQVKHSIVGSGSSGSGTLHRSSSSSSSDDSDDSSSSSDSGGNGLSLPGLGKVGSASEAAHALQRLAAKAKASERETSDRNHHSGLGGMSKPHHTLHRALSKRGLIRSSHGPRDLHHAMANERLQEPSGESDYNDDDSARHLGGLDSAMARSVGGPSHWENKLGDAPVGQNIQQYFSKANQNWMNAAGAWGAGAR